jgi:hypothetical protein
MIQFVSPSVANALGNSADLADRLVLKDSKMCTVLHHAGARIAKIAA